MSEAFVKQSFILILILNLASCAFAASDKSIFNELTEVTAQDELKRYEEGISQWTNRNAMAYWSAVDLEDVDIKEIYKKFKATVVSPPAPGHKKYAIKNGKEKLFETVQLGQSLHNLFLAMNEEDFARYGRLIGLMREILYIDSVHIPLAIKGDNSRGLYWYEIHNSHMKLIDEEILCIRTDYIDC